MASGLGYANECTPEILKLVRQHGLEDSITQFAKLHQRPREQDGAVDSLVEDAMSDAFKRLRESLGPSVDKIEVLLAVAEALKKEGLSALPAVPTFPVEEGKKLSEEITDLRMQEGHHRNSLIAPLPIKDKYEVREVAKFGLQGATLTSSLSWGHRGLLAYGKKNIQWKSGLGLDHFSVEVGRLNLESNTIDAVTSFSVDSSVVDPPIWLTDQHLLVADRRGKIYLIGVNSSPEKELSILDPRNGFVAGKGISLSVSREGLVAVPGTNRINFYQYDSSLGLTPEGEYPLESKVVGKVAFSPWGGAIFATESGQLKNIHQSQGKWNVAGSYNLGEQAHSFPAINEDGKIAIYYGTGMGIFQEKENGEIALQLNQDHLRGQPEWLDNKRLFISAVDELNTATLAFDGTNKPKLMTAPAYRDEYGSYGIPKSAGPVGLVVGTEARRVVIKRQGSDGSWVYASGGRADAATGRKVTWGENGLLAVDADSDIKILKVE